MSELTKILLAEEVTEPKEVLSVRVTFGTTDRLEKISEKTGKTKAKIVNSILAEGIKEIESNL
jgi:predicted DNA-binding protein